MLSRSMIIFLDFRLMYRILIGCTKLSICCRFR
ncbi:hypothetical protein M6B38_289695 [Iris pallida]|uniref:Uncharacterized protein n=1 Tax=Iris pallida TaxID=29817 RepID=A0AAX6HW77_IRIPA|nr:hypothetical protein M6B38_289695 [Iris pallida]